MDTWSRDNTLLIMAGEGYRYEGTIGEGFMVCHPYLGKNLGMRLLRESFFRIRFLPNSIWYNKKMPVDNIENIVVYDAIITAPYLKWLRLKYPDAKIVFMYENLIGHARHILPKEIPERISIWTYDSKDSNQYRISLFDGYYYYPSFIKRKKETKYDVLFIGRDKGRGDKLVDLEKKLRELGLRTKFIITKDGRFSRRKPYYEKELSYSEISDYLAESRAVLNYTAEELRGITVRDAESVFADIKLITTNKHIVTADFYTENNVFILEEDNYKDIPSFLEKTRDDMGDGLKRKHTVDSFMSVILS